MKKNTPYASLEHRRKQAITLLRKGRTAHSVAETLGVTVRSVRRWKRTYDLRGESGLDARPISGRPRRLSPVQEAMLIKELQQGPRSHGWACDRWNAPLIQALISHLFGVHYHVKSISRMLARHGLTIRDLNVVASWHRR